jgi:elongation factor 1-gamma
MASLKIYTYPDNYRVWKALVAAQYNQIDIELPAFDMDAGAHKTDSFKAKNPMGKVPVLETPQGCLFESGAIARYVARLRSDANLLGATNFQQGQVDQWIDFCSNEVEPARGIWLYPILGYLTYNDKANQEARKELTTSLTVLNNHLLHNTFLVGNSVTLADIVNATALVDLYRLVFTPKFVSQFPNVTRWFTTLINQPEFSKVIGKVEFAKEEAQPPKAAKAEKAEKAEKPKGEKPAAAPKAEKPKKDEAAPAAAAAAAPRSEHQDLLDDEDAPKPKKANPLDSLPESAMNLDTVKKLAFSQRPFLPDFFEKLWPQFDAAGYSWYTCDYKYNSDNKEYWKLGNSLGGFIQRSDACRKYAMGSIQAAGPEDEEGPGPWNFTGAWLFRGPKMIPEMLEENPDSEYYEWNKVDVSTEEGKKKIKEYFIGETVNGLPVKDRRFFK